jgi:hypothetical protein
MAGRSKKITFEDLNFSKIECIKDKNEFDVFLLFDEVSDEFIFKYYQPKTTTSVFFSDGNISYIIEDATNEVVGYLINNFSNFLKEQLHQSPKNIIDLLSEELGEYRKIHLKNSHPVKHDNKEVIRQFSDMINCTKKELQIA